MSHDNPTAIQRHLASLGFTPLPANKGSLWVYAHDALGVRIERRMRSKDRYRIELECGAANNDSIQQAAVDVAGWGANDLFRMYADFDGGNIQQSASALAVHAERLTILASIANFSDPSPLLPVWIVAIRGVEPPVVFDSPDQAAWHLATALKEESGTGCEIAVICDTMTREDIDSLKDA